MLGKDDSGETQSEFIFEGQEKTAMSCFNYFLR
jgi:hypothetical protein